MLLADVEIHFEKGNPSRLRALEYVFAQFAAIAFEEADRFTLFLRRIDGDEYRRALAVGGHDDVRDGDHGGAVALPLEELGGEALHEFNHFVISNSHILACRHRECFQYVAGRNVGLGRHEYAAFGGRFDDLRLHLILFESDDGAAADLEITAHDAH